MIQLLIKNANIIDGTANKSYKANIAIDNGKIIAIDKDLQCEAKQIVDAKSQTVTPGFIDVHGHTDMFAFVDPECSAKLKQGVTTELAGQCGFTLAPISNNHWAEFYGYYSKLGAPLNESFKQYTSFQSYLNMLEQLPLGINLGLFVGHGTLRIAAMGLDNGKPNTDQLQKMKILLQECLESGAFGLSSGLMYAPGSYADEQEIIELCEIVNKYQGHYTSHLKNQGNSLVECVKQTINIGAKTKIAVNISHHKAVGKKNWGKVKETCSLINEANNAGIKVSHDTYPYIASSTTLSGTLPPSCLKDGAETFLKQLKDKKYQQQLKDKIFNPDEDWDNDIKENGFNSLLIIRAAHTPKAVGKTITEYALSLGQDEFDTYVELLLQNQLDVSDICFSMSEDDVEYLLKHKSCMICTDSLYVAGMPMTHPRSIGSFPRVLGRYVREKQSLTLEQAVYKMTGLAAENYNLTNKGKIAVGYDADIVIFNKEKIIDKSTFSNPIQDNEGIKYVIVNGEIAVKDNKTTGIRCGKIIRRNN
ncbi:D-aminoacylase [Clostridium sp. 'deep sea']|uniref:N-acyl-D-amino-acid deacylase family protein n=1 Tax=Clostridium sp. 'deep sea' TaxID=2779445 RepID=UPI00189685B2|nr:D-aminoacylase [Clostridium sp. 'deep sea']QOR35128.1 D-aminoacylase [Clostridium sp. 'deep sea']